VDMDGPLSLGLAKAHADGGNVWRVIEILCGWRRRNGYPLHLYGRDAGVERRDAAELAYPVRGHLPPSLRGVSLEDATAETATEGDGAASQPWWSLPFSTVGGDDGGNRTDSASNEASGALASLHSAVPSVAAVWTVPGGVYEYHLVLRSLCCNVLELRAAGRGGGRRGSLDAQLGAAKSRLTAVRGDVRDAHADRLEELAPGAGDALRGRGRGGAWASTRRPRGAWCRRTPSPRPPPCARDGTASQ